MVKKSVNVTAGIVALCAVELYRHSAYTACLMCRTYTFTQSSLLSHPLNQEIASPKSSQLDFAKSILSTVPSSRP